MKPAMNVLSATLRQPCCSTRYVVAPHSAAAGHVAPDQRVDAVVGHAHERELDRVGIQDASSVWIVEKWLPECSRPRLDAREVLRAPDIGVLADVDAARETE
jgi:hypothetical protein